MKASKIGSGQKSMTKKQIETPHEQKLYDYFKQKKVRMTPQFQVQFWTFDFKVAGYPLLVEVDGSEHNYMRIRQKDYIKDRYARKEGFNVIRFTNYEIDRNGVEYCLNEIKEVIKGMPKSPKERIYYYLSFGDRFRNDLEELPIGVIIALSFLFVIACILIIALLV